MLAGEVAQLRRAAGQGEELADIGPHVLGADEVRHLARQHGIVRAVLVVVDARRVVVDERERFGHGAADILPEGMVGLGGHGHEEGVADMGAQDAAARGVGRAVDHAPRIAPGNADLGGDAESLRLIGEDIDDPLELVQLDGIELAVAIGGVDAMDACGMQPAHVLAQDGCVEAVVLIERRGDRGPDAVQVLARQAIPHRYGTVVHDPSRTQVRCAIAASGWPPTTGATVNSIQRVPARGNFGHRGCRHVVVRRAHRPDATRGRRPYRITNTVDSRALAVYNTQSFDRIVLRLRHRDPSVLVGRRWTTLSRAEYGSNATHGAPSQIPRIARLA